MATKTKKAKTALKPKLARRTRAWIREEFALWGLMDGTAQLPPEWFPDLPTFGEAAADCDEGDGDSGTPDKSGPPMPGGNEAGEGEGTGEPTEAGTGEYAPGDVPGTGDVGDEGEAGAEGGEEGDGGDEQGAAEAGAEPVPADQPATTQLKPRGTTFRPADAEDRGTIFSHFAKDDGRGHTQYRREFSSVQDFITQPFANPGNLDVFRKELMVGGQWRSWSNGPLRSQTRQSDLTWYGAETPDQAADYAVHGWPEGAERVRTLLADIEAPQPVSVKRKLRRGDQGDELDIHAVYRGALDRAWSRRQRTHHRSRMTVRLAVQLGGSQLMRQEQLFWRGAAIAKLNELLEDAGYGVELMCVESTHVYGRNHQAHQLFCLKDAGTPLNLDQVAGVICSAGFYRTWGFRSVYAICEHQLPVDKFDTALGNSYTNAVDPLTHELYLLGADGTPTFAVPVDVYDAKSAREFINETLAALAAGLQEGA